MHLFKSAANEHLHAFLGWTEMKGALEGPPKIMASRDTDRTIKHSKSHSSFHMSGSMILSYQH